MLLEQLLDRVLALLRRAADRVEGPEVRVTRTSDGAIIWSGTKTRPVLDLPILARLVAQEVVTRIGAQLTAQSPRSPPQKTAEVYELLLRGMYVRSRYNPTDLRQALKRSASGGAKAPAAPGKPAPRRSRKATSAARSGRRRGSRAAE